LKTDPNQKKQIFAFDRSFDIHQFLNVVFFNSQSGKFILNGDPGMLKILTSFVALVILLSICLTLVRNYDEFLSYRAWKKLAQTENLDRPETFSSEMVADLPPPARRYFEYMIEPGTPLKTVARIKMGGRIGLGPKDAPDYMDMRATQILAFPEGFVWSVKSGRGPMVLTGFDAFYKDKSWSRFWLMHTIPVGRAGGRSKQQEDHRRAAFGRLVAETTFWSPAALLPSENVSWSMLDENRAVATVTYLDLEQSVEIHINSEGQPHKVVIPRWSDANSENVYQIQPFGGYLSTFRDFSGFRLPTHVEGGNFIGTDKYFPFYVADVHQVTFED